jgi:hypothetical protein
MALVVDAPMFHAQPVCMALVVDASMANAKVVDGFCSECSEG